jgi:hypothetical protein
MPPNDSFGFYDDQRLPPVAPETTKYDPEKTVSAAKLRSFDRPFHGGHLLSERKVFQSEIEILLRSQKHGKKQSYRLRQIQDI